MKKQSIDRQEGEAVDLTKEENRINNKIYKITAKKCCLLQEQMEHTEKCLKASMQKVGVDLEVKRCVETSALYWHYI